MDKPRAALHLRTMQAESFETARAFLRDAERDLSRREVEHHLMLGVAYGLAAEGSNARPGVFITVRDADGLALAALMTPPRPLLLESDRMDVASAVVSLAQCMEERQVSPAALVGVDAHANAFVQEWQRRTASTADVRMRQREYVLHAVAQTRMASGALRRAEQSDLPLLERWMGEFMLEAIGPDLDPEMRAHVATRIAKGELYLWEDPEPRSMAASARPTRRGIAVNSVYTPEEWRGRGYATSCVASLSELLLSEGRDFCVLYTDLANPTSNAIYARIGYRAVADSMVVAFETGKRGVGK